MNFLLSFCLRPKKLILDERKSFFFVLLFVLWQPSDAYARGGGDGFGLIFYVVAFLLLVRFAPALKILVASWVLLATTLVPIGFGIYMVWRSAGRVSLILGVLGIMFGIFLAIMIFGKEIGRAWKNHAKR